MHDGKLAVAREPRSEGVVMTDWLLDFAFVGLLLEEKAMGTEIDAVRPEPSTVDSQVRQHGLQWRPHGRCLTRNSPGKGYVDTASNSSLCLAGALAVGAAALVLVLEPEDTDTAEITDHGGGIVVVGHAVVILVASFDDIQIGEERDAHAFRSWTFDGLCY